MKKFFLIIAGYSSLTLGIIGIFVPLLPTTPFLLLSTACFVRSSDRLHHWITHHRIFGNYIRSYRQFRAVSGRIKVFSILLLWTFIGYSILFMAISLWIKAVLLLIAIGVSLHILSLHTLTRDMMDQLKRNHQTNRPLPPEESKPSQGQND